MSKDQDNQKKELIFRILDDLKAGGEKINAEKVARLAQMGKQTVLPYYNEWRFLDQAEKQDGGCELPLDLVRVLKRLLIEWKTEVASELLQLQEQAKKESEMLKATIDELTGQNTSLTSQIHENQKQAQTLFEDIDALKDQLHQRDQMITTLTSGLEAEKEKNAELKQQINRQQAQYKEELAEKERAMDRQYRGQIDHWMKALDDERQHSAKLARDIEQLRVERLAEEKERHAVENRLSHKSKAYIAACEERNALRDELQEQTKKQAPSLELLSRLLLLLDSPQDAVMDRTRTLIQSEYHAQELQKGKTQLEQKLADQNEQLAQMQAMALELEKSKGYIAALESTLNRPSQGTETEAL